LEGLGRLSNALSALNRHAQLAPGDVQVNNPRVELKHRLDARRD
jgi:hypothetical protein